MLIEYIERLRKESPEVRRSAVYLWTGIIVGAIIFLYIVVRAYGFVVATAPTPGADVQHPYERSE